MMADCRALATDFPVILHRDDGLLALNKPPNWLAHRTNLFLDGPNCRDYLAEAGIGTWHPLHRLDRKTSGVLLFGATSEVARTLGADFAAARVEKAYLAVVRGWAVEVDVIDEPMADLDGGTMREARTEFRCLGRVELAEAVDRYPTTRYSLLLVRPRTGRQHQIRRHLRRRDHPVIGDTTYGQTSHNRFFASRFGMPHLCLHAWNLRFTHPLTGERHEITAPLWPPLARLLAALGWPEPLP